jgi:hypothetical protein
LCKSSLISSFRLKFRSARQRRRGTSRTVSPAKGKRRQFYAFFWHSEVASNMRQLIEKDHVLAVIGNVDTPTASVAVPIANEQKTLLFAPFAGGPNLRNEPPDRYVINRGSLTVW